MSFDTAYFSIGQLDRLSYQDTFMHRLDPRTKVITTLVFLLAVISFPKYEVTALLPFFLFPVLFMTLGDIPAGFVIKKVLIVSPFAVFVGIFNPFFDRAVALNLFGLPISAGWVSFVSIILKFILSISAAILLVATSSFPGVTRALQRLGMPRLFTTQLIFLYRYMFVLMEEAMRIVRARDMRSFGRRGLGVRVFIRLIGMLFMRTISRAERIYNAMLSRGFSGDIPSVRRHRFTAADVLFALSALAFLALFRFVPVTHVVGRFVQGIAG
jgi:cobalt/nickel transport system permease protein